MAPLIKRYSEIVTENGYGLITLLPKYANFEFFESTAGVKRYVLPSSIYGPTLNENFLINLFNRILVLIIGIKSKDTYIKKLIRRKQITKAFSQLSRISKSTDERILLLLPTADPLSIELAIKISKSDLVNRVHLRIRMVGSESRGILGHVNVFKDLQRALEIKNFDLKIGFETRSYADYLVRNGICEKYLIWSPWPTFESANNHEKKKPNQIVIGFLGGAKQRKGFDLIPKIISNLNQSGKDFKFIIQKSAYPWPEYHGTITEIQNFFGKQCELQSEILDLNELLAVISSVDCLILPYDASSYSLNASGLLYHASDYCIPVVTFSGVGFAQEIFDFDIGRVITGLDAISTGLFQALRIKSNNFRIYNRERNLANKYFLFHIN